MMSRGRWIAPVVCLLAARLAAQPVFTGPDVFPLDEFADRRARVVERIGDAVAILSGTTERPGEQALRQNNQFFYLCGVVEPRAFLVVDGRTKRTQLFLQPYSERREERMFGPGLHPGEASARAAGVDVVRPRDEFGALVDELSREGRTMYTPFRPEVLGEASSSDPVALAKATREDPWDGRPSREETFVAKLRARAPRSDVRDLDPILDAMRTRKSPREIAIIRDATRIATLGILEAMRHTKPGMTEYELQAEAEYVFKKHGAYGPSYFALVATGTNTFYSHYHKNTATLADGDLVQFDYAPDYKYYQSDVTRVFPANGRFSARQRELYTVYLRLYQALMSSIRVHASPADIARVAAARMASIVDGFPFTDAAIEAAARAFVERYRSGPVTSLGHAVGMEVHDVGGAPPTLEPGMVFTIEPAMQLPAEHLGLRLEDMILMTAEGYENLSASLPVDPDAIEAIMGGRGQVGVRRGQVLP
ncbi:MAG: Xaa-Pro peptidase family protein [Vicinamibacterales bacterium]